MPAQLIEKKLFLSTSTLCDDCAHAVPQLCAFIRTKDPEAALALVGAEAVKVKVACKDSKINRDAEIYKVTSCHKYRPGDLPDLAEISCEGKTPEPSGEVKEYDLSCPVCGSADSIAVAGMRDKPSKTQEWFCRCKSCEKSFRPRKREARKAMYENSPVPEDIEQNNEKPLENKGFEVYENQEKPENPGQKRLKTRLEIAREKLTCDQYLVLKSGEPPMIDKEIMQQYGVPNDIFYRMKKEWGLIGQGKPATATVAAQPQERKDDPAPARLTVTKMLQLQQEMAVDLTEITCIMDNIGSNLPRVEKLLAYYRDEYQHCLDRICEVFNSTEIAL